ncbi:orotidine-5'-phosphate decarboxylase [Verrucomicrobium sp. GAS474]|uniref:orotidine-5'-phosphate decarboxylase n=1 Tax=Verrucomicrobium sp. GAS474 TaxID=1882831 RepID=UPI0008797DA5|nr:orotidine-5'-phosphate decarboxylase [Verrucomicrobium sp. GAS474]SDU22421.1 orotidine-5'-phosphate decarboxylase [Verrucomicrobium sp. GAS474]
MPADPIIVALDFDEAEQALRLVAQIKDYLRFFKVGSQLFTREGPLFIRQLREQGVEVFLDLKFHDIPETVRKAVRAAAALDVRFLTIHASGGPAMIEAALKGAEGTGTTVLGVTVLTSMDEASLRATGQARTPGEQVLFLAEMAQKAGLKGLVCSPLEIAPIRERLGKEIVLVTPGIRGTADRLGDQKRTLSAEEALRLGASHLVIGRPITEAADPVAAARALATVSA